MYTLEVYSSAVFGSMTSLKEAQSNVSYPSDSDDFSEECGKSRAPWPLDVSSRERHSPVVQQEHVSWLQGWNFTTDLYRVLEYAIDHSRPRQRSANGDHIFEASLDHQDQLRTALMTSIEAKYASLPECFKQLHPVTPTSKIDACGFQAANIAATFQLVRMTLFDAADATVDEKCEIVNSLLLSFSRIPIEYLRAISTPLLYHLAGIGTILGPVFKRPLSNSTYQQVRSVLLALADFLADLETGLSSATNRQDGASGRLRSHVIRLDETMNRQQLLDPLAGQDHVGPFNVNTSSTNVPNFSPEFQLPTSLLDEWSWAFDFAQAGQAGFQ